MELQTLSARIDTCRAYLDALERSFPGDWRPAHDAYREGKLRLVEALALAHPAHYEELDARSSVRGPRQFAAEVGVGSLPCRADTFWGYPCVHGPGVSLVAD